MEKKRKILILALVFIILLIFIIRQSLKYSYEIAQHNMRGAEENAVFISEDGHKEAVYNKEGNLVTDASNMGSYNFYHPMKQPVRHFVSDTAPWIIWGNAKNDPTTLLERSGAFLKDFGMGFLRSFRIIK